MTKILKLKNKIRFIKINFFQSNLQKICNEISTNFKYWLLSIEEDNPLPYEIKYALFILNFNNNSINLCFSGTEIKLKNFEPSTYFPLESQYFYNKNLLKLFSFLKKNFIFKSKKQNSKLFSKNKKIMSYKYYFIKLFSIFLAQIKNLKNFKHLSNKIFLVGEEFTKILYV